MGIGTRRGDSSKGHRLSVSDDRDLRVAREQYRPKRTAPSALSTVFVDYLPCVGVLCADDVHRCGQALVCACLVGLIPAVQTTTASSVGIKDSLSTNCTTQISVHDHATHIKALIQTHSCISACLGEARQVTHQGVINTKSQLTTPKSSFKYQITRSLKLQIRLQLAVYCLHSPSTTTPTFTPPEATTHWPLSTFNKPRRGRFNDRLWLSKYRRIQ